MVIMYFKVYAASIYHLDLPNRDAIHYKFFASKRRVFEYYRLLRYRLIPPDDVDIILHRYRFINDEKRLEVHVTEKEVDNL